MESTALNSIIGPTFPFELLERFELSTAYLKLSLRSDGSVAHFRSLPSGKDYLSALTAPVPFMRITDRDGKVFKSKSINRTESTLRVGFEGSSVTAKVHVRELPSYLTFELTAIDDHTISLITLLDLPLTLKQHVSSTLASCRDGGYAAAVVPLNIHTHSRPIRSGAHATLVAEADGRVRLEGTKFALVACAPADLLRIVEKIESENALPHPTLGGTWARLSPEQKKSYLFIDVQNDGAATAAAIRYAHDGGFGYVVVYVSQWAKSYGSYDLRIPLESLSKQVHKAGLKLGLHMMDLVVSKNDPLVRPIPQDGFLMYPALQTILAKDLDKDVKRIETTEAPSSKLLRAHDYDVYRGRDLRIDDEIITYSDVLFDSAPGAMGFSVFERGANGTVPAAHKAGAVVQNFAEFLGHYLPDVRHPLYDKVAKAAATVLNKHEIDFIYPDGIGENVAAWPPTMIPVWYAGNLALFRLYEGVSRELIFAHFPTSDYAWHVFSRGNTTDYATRGLLTHFDVESLKGADNPSEMQPFELGWFGYFKNYNDAASTRPRELNYAWAKAAGYDAAISLETFQDDLANNGRTKENLSVMKAWESLKLGSRMSATLRTKLREWGKEFVIQDIPVPFLPAKTFVVTPVDYGAERYITKIDGVQNVWTFDDKYGSQPLRLSLEVNPTFAAYGAAGKVTLLDPAKPIAPRLEGNGPLGRPARGTANSSLLLTKSAEAAPDGSASARAHFTNSSLADKAAPANEWACVQLVLDDAKGVDLRRHRALGTRVKGDGSGAILHFVLEDISQQVRDYYVVLNFTGWKYVPMLEAAGAEVYGFEYVYSNYFALRRINFASIRRLYVFITNAKKGGTVNCQFTRVEALEESALSVRNPGFSINATSVVFPVEIGTEGYMEFDGLSARVFDKDGMLQHNVAPTGSVPTVKSGTNSATFFCDSSSTFGQSVKVNLITHGSALT